MVSTLNAPPGDGIINSEYGITHANWDFPAHLGFTQLRSHIFMPTVRIASGENPVELSYSDTYLDVESLAFEDFLSGKVMDGNQFLNRRLFNDALLVYHKNKVLHESYRNGMTETDRHINHSTTKSFIAMLVGIAIDEGMLNPYEPFSHYFPELGEMKAWSSITLQHLLDMNAGIQYEEHYDNPDSMFWSYAKAVGYCPAAPTELIGCKAWFVDKMTESEFEPGSHFNYTSPFTNALGEALQNVYKKPLAQIFEEKIYSRIGAETDAWFNVDCKGFPVAEGQLNLTLRDFLRSASLMLNGGKNISGTQVIPARFVEDTWTPSRSLKQVFARSDYTETFPGAQYRNQFWIVEPEKKRFAMLGIHGQFAWFDLDRELAIVGFGSHPEQSSTTLITAVKQLWDKIGHAIDTLK